MYVCRRECECELYVEESVSVSCMYKRVYKSVEDVVSDT